MAILMLQPGAVDDEAGTWRGPLAPTDFEYFGQGSNVQHSSAAAYLHLSREAQASLHSSPAGMQGAGLMLVARGVWQLIEQTEEFVPVPAPLLCNDVCGVLYRLDRCMALAVILF